MATATTAAVSSNFDHLQDVSMFDLFRTEVEDNALQIETGLVEVERGGEELPQVWRSLMRAAHSVKGAARMVNISAGVQVAHAMESCFVAGQQGKIPASRDLVDLMLRGKDLLVAIARTPEAQIKGWVTGEHADVIKGYSVTCETFLLDPPVARVEQARDEEAGVEDSQDKDVGHSHEEPEAEAEEAENPDGHDENPETESESAAESTPATPLAASKESAAAPLVTARPREVKPPVPPAAQPNPRGTPSRPATHISNSGPVSTAGPAPASGSGDSNRMLRVTAEHLDRLLGLSGESLVNARRLHALADGMRRLKRMHRQVIQLIDRAKTDSKDERLGQILQEAHGKAMDSQHYLVARLGEMDRYDREAVDLSHRLYRRAQACRMRPFADGIQHFPRMVRDLATTLGKEARLEMAGVAVEVDRDILDQLEAPLTHMIRNSLDHGIEFPDERALAGKPPVGVLRLEARHAAGKLIVSFSDDGRGMDIEHIRSVVLERGLATAATAERLSQAELLNFLFLPGFTLRDEVS
ncbi:MAG TPA: Hpt domain-containing protein, partial [Candidatus Methylacidiphilales bacterium]|nr:Hpt domain-containing protein [Candidatus Methylacidiphilales bacterium]